MTYGVIPTGWKKKPLAVILAEREQANIDMFGSSVIQTPESPLGQINAILAEAEAEQWEVGEDVYQSYDVDEAEGIRLDALARLRLVQRAVGELDASLAQAIHNKGVANTRDADFYRDITNITGVTYARIFSNDTDAIDANGMDPHSVAVAAIGGDDTEIALTARRYIVPGISSFGNLAVNTLIDGFCRTIYLIRPLPVTVNVEIDVTRSNDDFGCPPPALTAIAQGFVTNMTGANRPANGVDITTHLVRTAVTCSFPNVEVSAVRVSRDSDPVGPAPLAIAFLEIADIALANVTVAEV